MQKTDVKTTSLCIPQYFWLYRLRHVHVTCNGHPCNFITSLFQIGKAWRRKSIRHSVVISVSKPNLWLSIVSPRLDQPLNGKIFIRQDYKNILFKILYSSVCTDTNRLRIDDILCPNDIGEGLLESDIVMSSPSSFLKSLTFAFWCSIDESGAWPACWCLQNL